MKESGRGGCKCSKKIEGTQFLSVYLCIRVHAFLYMSNRNYMNETQISLVASGWGFGTVHTCSNQMQKFSNSLPTRQRKMSPPPPLSLSSPSLFVWAFTDTCSIMKHCIQYPHKLLKNFFKSLFCYIITQLSIFKLIFLFSVYWTCTV